MDFSPISIPVKRSQIFRTPFRAERELGLWVDRIGEGSARPAADISLRILGLYGAVLIERGAGVFTTGTRCKVRVKKGDILLLFPDLPHSYSPDTEWRTRWIVWGGPEAALLDREGYLSSSLPVIENQEAVFGRAFAELMPIINREDLAAVLLRKTVMLRMIHGFYRATRGGPRSRGDNSRIELAAAYMQEHSGDPIHIPVLAKQFGMSETHFRRCFKEHTGRSPSHYMISLRISAAKRLLADGVSIKETAAAIGIEDEFYFMRLFKKEAGVSPGRFARKASRESPPR